MYFPFVNKRIIMKLYKTSGIVALAIVLTNCSSAGKTIEVKKTAGYQPNHGPFDSRGNYIESWADNPPHRKYVSSYTKKSTKTYTPPKKTYTPPTKTYTPPTKTYTPPKKTYTPPKKTYTPPKKITPRAKPPISHTVKKGDTLYSLSRRYGSTVSAIQKANNISGTNIRLGQKLVIPRK